jgi:hypothetical protein
MSPWEFTVCIEGWNRAHGGAASRPPTEDEFDELMQLSAQAGQWGPN